MHIFAWIFTIIPTFNALDSVFAGGVGPSDPFGEPTLYGADGGEGIGPASDPDGAV